MPLHDPAHAFVPYPDVPVPHAATGPLSGLRFGVKDLFDVAGYPTGGGSPIVLAMFAALGERRGLKFSEFTVNLQNDPLKEYIARGTQILPAKPAAKLASDCVAWCVEHAPGWSPMTVCVNHLNAGGAGSSRATAMALANAMHYIGLLLEQGHTIDQVAPLLHMFADERHDFFVIVANLRALRRIWARLMKDRYGATLPEAMALRTTVYGHGQEALGEPLNNIARTAFGTLAGPALGGVLRSHRVLRRGVSTPTEQSVTSRCAISRSSLICTASTPSTCSAARTSSSPPRGRAPIMTALGDIDQAGGAQAVIGNGLCRRWMTEGAVRRQRGFDSGARPWVTVNKWPQKPDVPHTAFRVNRDSVERQHRRLAEVKAQRDPKRVAAALANVDAAAAAANQMPAVLAAVHAHVTVGDLALLARALRRVRAQHRFLRPRMAESRKENPRPDRQGGLDGHDGCARRARARWTRAWRSSTGLRRTPEQVVRAA
jgi:methylmalonyl-CoA mutase N-terminal domain/subunit